MGRRKANPDNIQDNYSNSQSRTPARTPEDQELYMVSLAMDLVEKRLREGTASAAETVHFLKLGSSRERLEQEDRRKDIQLKAAKTGAIEASHRTEELFENAINAMRRYSGHGGEDE